MSQPEFEYPLDLTGTQPSNRIVNEKHTVTPSDDVTLASFIVARACPFFEHTLVVKDGSGAHARELVMGQDYICTHQAITLTHLAKKPVFGSITFIDRRYTGTVYISYNTVGGEWAFNSYSLIEQLTRDMFSIRHVSFDQIVGVPSSYPTPPHHHDPQDMVGLSAVVEKLTEIAASIRASEGLYAELAAQLNSHFDEDSSHSPSQVGLGNVRNFAIATDRDMDISSNSKYLTPKVFRDWYGVNALAMQEELYSEFLKAEDAQAIYATKTSVYSKNSIDTGFYSRDESDLLFARKTEILDETDVGRLVETLVDTSQFMTRAQLTANFYSKSQTDSRFYTRSQSEGRYLTPQQGDQRYLQTVNSAELLAERPNNRIIVTANSKLYVGMNSANSVFDLYIDAIHGSDNNVGSRSEPLRTLIRAHELSPNYLNNNWHLKYYTLEQLSQANSFYDWNFHHFMLEGLTRTIKLYGHTWIDGAMYQRATQLGDGEVNYLGIAEVNRLPIFIKSYRVGVDRRIYSAVFGGDSTLIVEGACMVLPKWDHGVNFTRSTPPKHNSHEGGSFIVGQGKMISRGCDLIQVYDLVDGGRGDTVEPSTEYGAYAWVAQLPEHHSHLIFEGCSLYAATIKVRSSLVTMYPSSKSVSQEGSSWAHEDWAPFRYINSSGIITIAPQIEAGAGAIAAGATQREANLALSMTPKLFYGLSGPNNVVTNIVNNFNLTVSAD